MTIVLRDDSIEAAIRSEILCRESSCGSGSTGSGLTDGLRHQGGPAQPFDWRLTIPSTIATPIAEETPDAPVPDPFSGGADDGGRHREQGGFVRLEGATYPVPSAGRVSTRRAYGGDVLTDITDTRDPVLPVRAVDQDDEHALEPAAVPGRAVAVLRVRRSWKSPTKDEAPCCTSGPAKTRS
jgi:hypothetical protein